MTSWKTKVIQTEWKPPGSRKLSLCQICRSLQMQTQVLERPKCRRSTPNNLALLNTVQTNHWRPFAYLMNTSSVIHQHCIISSLSVIHRYFTNTLSVLHQNFIVTSSVLYQYFSSTWSVLHLISTSSVVYQYFTSTSSELYLYKYLFFTWTHACALEHCDWQGEMVRRTVEEYCWALVLVWIFERIMRKETRLVCGAFGWFLQFFLRLKLTASGRSSRIAHWRPGDADKGRWTMWQLGNFIRKKRVTKTLTKLKHVL